MLPKHPRLEKKGTGCLQSVRRCREADKWLVRPRHCVVFFLSIALRNCTTCSS